VSGIAGIVRFDGRPVERVELEALAARLGLPDGPKPELRTLGPVAFALAPLDVDGVGAQTLAGPEAPAPFVLCDARIDARKDLVARLRAAGEHVSANARDDALIAAAWRAWGTGCASELLGDYAFALWDEARGQLFCARDAFGVKPFYYARNAEVLVFSNALECLRHHPAVSDALDELWIADFLLVGHGLQQDASAYRDIARLAPGHALAWDAARGLRVERWFDLPLEEPFRGRGPDDLVAEFRALLRGAVEDRLRGQRAVISMSGGLDSTSVAATAREVLTTRGAPYQLNAFTLVSPRLLAADDEDRYALAAAAHLGIPVTVIQTDRDSPVSYAHNARDEPEPTDASAFDPRKEYGAQGERSPQSVLTGQGGDVGFFHEWDYAAGYLREGRWLALAQDAARHLQLLGRMPPLYLRTRLRLAMGKPRRAPPLFPPWLRSELVERYALRDRFDGAWRSPPRMRAARSGAHWGARQPLWPVLFERSDPAVTGLPLEFRHPYFDLRVMRFLLRLPEIPWCVDKTLLRIALRGLLPEAVRTRPKAPLPGFPEYEAMRRGSLEGIERSFAAQGLDRYVDLARLRMLAKQRDRLRPSEAELLLRPAGLAMWLMHSGKTGADCKMAAKEPIQ
jgi:asparagine synthase (glutamine-hydrolysing)